MPVYTYQCRNCFESFDDIRPISARNDIRGCPVCGHEQSSMRDTSQELPVIHNTEKAFQPYYDIGAGHYMRTRAEQKRVWKEKGLVPMSGRELYNQWERGMTQPVKKYDDKVQREKFRKAYRKGVARVAENRRITITT